METATDAKAATDAHRFGETGVTRREDRLPRTPIEFRGQSPIGPRAFRKADKAYWEAATDAKEDAPEEMREEPREPRKPYAVPLQSLDDVCCCNDGLSLPDYGNNHLQPLRKGGQPLPENSGPSIQLGMLHTRFWPVEDGLLLDTDPGRAGRFKFNNVEIPQMQWRVQIGVDFHTGQPVRFISTLRPDELLDAEEQDADGQNAKAGQRSRGAEETDKWPTKVYSSTVDPVKLIERLEKVLLVQKFPIRRAWEFPCGLNGDNL